MELLSQALELVMREFFLLTSNFHLLMITRIYRSRYSLSNNVFGSALPSVSSRTNGFNNHMGFSSLFSSKNPLESEEDKSKNEDRVSTPDVKSYLRMTDPDDKFPTLVRRDGNPSVVSSPFSSFVDFLSYC